MIIGVAFYTKSKRLWLAILVGVTSACLADVISYEFLKPFFARIRPCREWRQLIDQYQGCAGYYGFPSNHASNGMAAATSLWLYAGRNWGIFGVTIAFLVGLSRVFVGVHYPLDVLFGFAFGACMTGVVYLILRPLCREKGTLERP